MDIREQMDQIYRDLPLEDIPWHLPEPPRLLVEAVESGTVTPCRAVDLGCGAGACAVWLAGRGFDVTGIDISQQAIGHAGNLAEKQGVSCRFVMIRAARPYSDRDRICRSFGVPLPGITPVISPSENATILVAPTSARP